MRGYYYLAIFIFGYEIIMHAILPMFTDASTNVSLTIFHHTYEYLMILGLMWNFRPREWPEYFTLEVAELINFDPNVRNTYVPPKLAPIEIA
jgi:hypothetical protein